MGNANTKKKWKNFRNFHTINESDGWVLRDIVDPCLRLFDESDFDDFLYELNDKFPDPNTTNNVIQELFLHLQRKYPVQSRERLRWRRLNKKVSIKKTASMVEECYCREDPMSFLDLEMELQLNFDEFIDKAPLQMDQWGYANSVDPTVELLRNKATKKKKHFKVEVDTLMLELGMNIDDEKNVDVDHVSPDVTSTEVNDKEGEDDIGQLETISDEVVDDDGPLSNEEEQMMNKNSNESDEVNNVPNGESTDKKEDEIDNMPSSNDEDENATKEMIDEPSSIGDGNNGNVTNINEVVSNDNDEDNANDVEFESNIDEKRSGASNGVVNVKNSTLDEPNELSARGHKSNDDVDGVDQDDNKVNSEVFNNNEDIKGDHLDAVSEINDFSLAEARRSLKSVAELKKSKEENTDEDGNIIEQARKSLRSVDVNKKNDNEQEKAYENTLSEEEQRIRAKKILEKRKSRLPSARSTPVKRRSSTAPVGTVARMLLNFGEDFTIEEASSDEDE